MDKPKRVEQNAELLARLERKAKQATGKSLAELHAHLQSPDADSISYSEPFEHGLSYSEPFKSSFEELPDTEDGAVVRARCDISYEITKQAARLGQNLQSLLKGGKLPSQAEESKPSFYDHLSTPEGDLALNSVVESIRESLRVLAIQGIGPSADYDERLKAADEAVGRTGPYDTLFSSALDYERYAHKVAKEANVRVGESLWPLLVENMVVSQSGRANVDFRVLELRGLLPEDAIVQAFIEREGLQTNVGPHEMIAAFRRHPTLLRHFDNTMDSGSPYLVSTGYSSTGESDGQQWLTIDSNNEDAVDEIKVVQIPDRLAHRSRLDVIRLLTVKSRTPITSK
jgi:hypothetical protein